MTLTTSQERNERVARLLAYVDAHTATEGHGYRARVRIAAMHPPTGPFPTVDDVDDAITATAPPATDEETTQP